MEEVTFKTVRMPAADIEKGIESVGRRARKLDNDIQLLGLAILAHIHEHREVSLANKLLLSMTKGQRRTALRDWFVLHGQCVLNPGTDAKERPIVFDKGSEYLQDEAEGTPWWNCGKPDELDDVLDVAGMLARIVAKLDKPGVQFKPGQEELVRQLKAMAEVSK